MGRGAPREDSQAMMGGGGVALVSTIQGTPGSECILRQEPALWRVSANTLPLQMLGPRPHPSGTSGNSRS